MQRTLATMAIIIGIAQAGIASAAAQSILELAVGLKFCRTVTDDTMRLRCFDGLLAEGTSSEQNKAAEKAEIDWTISESKSPIDDSPQVAAMLTTEKATLVLRCREKSTEVIFSPQSGYLGSGRIRVLTRFDDGKPIETHWSASSNGLAAFAPSAIQFISALRDNGKLFVRASGFSQTYDGEFNLKEVSAVREKVAATCKWPDKAKAKPN